MHRPTFIKQLTAYLLAGKSVNLHAPHGRGRRQTLENLLTVLVGVQVQKIDLKREQGMWNDWLKETLTLSGQVIVIIHNIEYITQVQKAALPSLKAFTLLCVSELSMGDKDMLEIEIPEMI
ncbi:MAG TPA: hypothetical protein EYP39_04075 [Ghiorsea sp.]|nr:hypothetical protein [Ghiorsea sp.]HIP07975.1 hypothetical protein [Mariprofundaceae bacterium]